MAATAIRDTDSSYSNAYHRFCSSFRVNLHENLVPRCTIFMSLVCCTPIIRAKSSTGFQRPRSLVDICVMLPFLPFLFRPLLFIFRSANMDRAAGKGCAPLKEVSLGLATAAGEGFICCAAGNSCLIC